MRINFIYKCKAENLRVQRDNETVTAISGVHKSERTTEDVQILIIENQVCHFLPRNLDSHFPKLYHLDVKNSGLRTVREEQLKMFPKLKYLYIRNNPIEALPENIFKHNPLLQFINLNDNKIKTVGEGIFTGLNDLISLSIERNVCVDGSAMGEEALRELIKEVGEKCSESVS